MIFEKYTDLAKALGIDLNKFRNRPSTIGRLDLRRKSRFDCVVSISIDQPLDFIETQTLEQLVLRRVDNYRRRQINKERVLVVR